MKKQITREGQKKITCLKQFAARYNKLKGEGMIPTVIAMELMDAYKCKETTYYASLREAREIGYITDSFRENAAACGKRRAGILPACEIHNRQLREERKKQVSNPKTKVKKDTDTVDKIEVDEKVIESKTIPTDNKPVVEKKGVFKVLFFLVKTLFKTVFMKK